MSRIILSYAFWVVDFRIYVNQILKENCKDLLKKDLLKVRNDEIYSVIKT